MRFGSTVARTDLVNSQRLMRVGQLLMSTDDGRKKEGGPKPALSICS
jgi:hypothetical protein